MQTVFNKTVLGPLLGAVLLYILFAYNLERTEWIKLLGFYIGLFVVSYHLYTKCKNDLKTLTYIAFGFRAIFLLALPNLSQDFYRFIWDGRMILEGFNPYLYTPQSFIDQGEFPVAQAKQLYYGMGNLSANNFTNYPPINQLCFTIAALFGGKSILGNVFVMRLLIIAADFGILHFGRKLLKALNLPEHRIFWYILNPFIIIELSGNLHFEAVMLFFLIWSMYLLYQGRWIWAAVIFACSVSVKLIPLLFLPLFWQWFIKRDSSTALGMTDDVISTERSDEKSHSDKDDEILNQVQDDKKNVIVRIQTDNVWSRNNLLKGIPKLLGFHSFITIVNILLFLPFFSKQFITNYTETVALWFNNFEFNASLYYIAREIGYTFRGYNEIEIIGKYISIIVICIVLLLTFLRKNKTMPQLITTMLLALTLYFFLSTTVHPWYLATLVLLSIFTTYRFPLVWSVVIILSYLAYLNTDNTENLWIIGLEYIIVYGFFIWEVFFKPKPNSIA